MHENILANVPTQDKSVGLLMLTLMDLKTYKQKKTENMETLKLMSLQKIYFLHVIKSISADC